MCSCHSILKCCVTFSGVKLSIRSFVLFIDYNIVSVTGIVINCSVSSSCDQITIKGMSAALSQVVLQI